MHLLFDVTVDIFGVNILSLEIFRQGGGDGDAAVPPAGTAHRDEKAELALLHLQRQQEIQQVFHLFHKGAGLHAVEDVLGHGAV